MHKMCNERRSPKRIHGWGLQKYLPNASMPQRWELINFSRKNEENTQAYKQLSSEGGNICTMSPDAVH